MNNWNKLSIQQKSDLMRIYLENGISSLDTMKKHYNSFATGGHLYQDGGSDEPNFVGGATALKKNYDYALEHLAEKYPVTAEGPWHDYGIHNPSYSQRAHWNELYRMYNRVAQRPDYQYLNPTNILEYTPIVGDAIDVGNSIYDLQQGNTGLGLAGLGMLVLPNFIEKPLKKLGKNIGTIVKNVFTDYNDLYEDVQNSFIKQYNKYPAMFNNSPAKNPTPKVSVNPIGYYWNGPMNRSLNYKKWELDNYKKIPMYSIDNMNTVYIRPTTLTYPNDYYNGLAIHELTHTLQDLYSKKGALGTRIGDMEIVANPLNPAYNNGLSEFEKLASKWKRSPYEFQSEVNRFKHGFGIPLNKSYNDLSDLEQYYLKNMVNERFNLPQYALDLNFKTLSDGLYFNKGGELK